MNLEPQKFFIGLMGFFSILLPGALLGHSGLRSRACETPGAAMGLCP